jgi:hypothetical protein
VKSLLFSVPLEGNYSIRAFNEGLIGFIGTDAGFRPFDVSSNVSFIPNAYFIPNSSTTASNSLPFADSF